MIVFNTFVACSNEFGGNFFLLGFGATELIAATMMEIKLKWLVSQRKRSMSFVKIQANAFRD